MTMPFYRLQGQKRVSDLVKWEVNPEYCREEFVLKGGSGSPRKIEVGTLIANLFGTGSTDITAAPVAGNTGDGTIAMAADPAFTGAVREGAYSVVCDTGGGDGVAVFSIEDPNGKNVGTVKSGAAFGKQIKFTITGGSVAFVEGDRFDVLVVNDEAEDANTIVEWNPASAGGANTIVGISLRDLTAPDGQDTRGGVGLFRISRIFRGSIIWPVGITDVHREQAINRLIALGILPR